ncbi:MAG: IS66 family insertion sequence element accessory protein TnpB [Paludibacter sp.]|nr:IS66 family insertion sequence element accessory protein TnpB [Paludibacter sp.]
MDRKEFMLFQVESWKQSGLSQQTFCDQAGIKLGTFSYWIRKSKNEEVQIGGFIPLKKPVFALENKYEIVYPNGVILRLDTDNLSELSALVNLY